MATATVPAKIVMKGTSQMSLHDRFSHLPAAATELIREQQVTMRNPKFTFTENRRLAREMERRPNVMAALKFRKERSVMQRLSAKARLGFRGGYRGRRGRGFYFGYRMGRGFWTGGLRGNRMTRGQWARAVLNGSYVTMNRRGGFRGRGRFRGGYRGWGGRNRGGRSPLKISKDDLDKQLDEYMAKTKPHLDSEIDSYMAEVMA